MKGSDDTASKEYPRLNLNRGSILLRVGPEIGNLWGLAVQATTGLGRREGYDVAIGRRSPQVVHCSDSNELRFLLTSLYCCLEILPRTDTERSIERLMHLFRFVRDRLGSRFTANEIQRCSTGGWPTLKDVVLYALVRRFRPQEVIETGVAQGISSTFILDALQQNGRGHLTSIDLPNFNSEGYLYEDGMTKDPTYVKEALGVGWLVPDSSRDIWTLLLGPSQDILPTLPTQPQLFFHDSKHTYDHMMFEFEWAWSRLPKGGLLVSDDIWWNAAFSDFLANHDAVGTVISAKVVGVAARMIE